MIKSVKNALLNTMLFLTLMSIVSLTSCSDNESNELNSSESVVGAWRYDFEEGGGYQLLILENNGSYSLIEFDFIGRDWQEYGTYSIKDNIMTRYLSDGDIEVYSILTHTTQKLIFRYEGEYLGQFSDDYDREIQEWIRIN